MRRPTILRCAYCTMSTELRIDGVMARTPAGTQVTIIDEEDDRGEHIRILKDAVRVDVTVMLECLSWHSS